MSNVSGINPVGERLVIRTLELEHKTASGIILSTTSQKEREEMSNTTGEVVAMGDDCNEHPHTRNVKIGDRIVFAKYAGLLYKGKDDLKYRVINSENVVATLDGDVKLVDPYLKTGQ